MQYSDINGTSVSRFGLGTKRFPTEDSSRVIHMDAQAAHGIVEACLAHGVNFFDTSYSNHKGEAETFLGQELATVAQPTYVATSFFEMVDPRFDYVFQKQRKKLERDCIDFYSVEGVTDLNQEVNVTSGAIDYLFERKEQGQSGQLGFSAELTAENLASFAKRYPWDFVRLRVNYFDWFEKEGRAQYEAACEAGLPIIAHGALRTGPATRLKDEVLPAEDPAFLYGAVLPWPDGAAVQKRPGALAVLKEADPTRSSIDWALRFVKSLPGVRTVSCNVYSVEQVEQGMAVFEDDVLLDGEQMAVLERAAQAQRTRKGPAQP